MLKKVLKELYDLKFYSKSSIAKNLNISENMVEDIISQLTRMGYLTEEMGSPTCSSKCAGCSVSNCNTIPIKMLNFTEKGNNLLNN